MSKITVYRYDDQDFQDGAVVASRGDHFSILTGSEKEAESVIRSTNVDGFRIRSTSLYTLENEALARRLQRLKKAKYLHELEVDCADALHKGDLNQFTEVEQAIQRHEPPSEPAEGYWAGTHAKMDRVWQAPYTEPRIEILVSKARVKQKV